VSRTTRIMGARTARRLSVVVGAALAASVALAVPASAHVEVESPGAAALAENVTLDFTAESESDKAGISKLEVILPEGIRPADITYKTGPKGWKLAATDRGYAVSGPAVATGEGAAYSVVVRQLPDAKSLAFKTLQSYADGRVDRWIELEKSDDGGGHGHGNSAPVLALKAAAPGAKPVAPSPTAPATTAAPSTDPAEKKPSGSANAAGAEQGDRDEKAQDDDGMNAALPIGLAAAVVVLVGGLWWFKRRGAGSA